MRPRPTFEDAWAWLVSIDKLGERDQEPHKAKWVALCRHHPDYVLRGLRRALARHTARAERGQQAAIRKPLAWMARKARDEGYPI